jgi:Lon protease-like protein
MKMIKMQDGGTTIIIQGKKRFELLEMKEEDPYFKAEVKVLVEEQEAGVWLIRTATVIPDNERWLHEAQAASELARALEWARQHPASDTQTDALLANTDPSA